ncbi:MAG: ATP-binding protein [Desulfarculaceae bacterium]|jgi:K+-sensing histidine kinase KdpD
MEEDIRKQNDELKAKNERLSTLVKISRILADPEMGLDKKLQVCVEDLARLAQAERGSLMLVEEDALVVRAATNTNIIGMATPISESTISTDVVRSGEPVFIKDVDDSNYARVSRNGDQSSYRTGSLISLPLKEGGQTVGVLNLSDKVGSPHFDESDLALAQGFADQVTRLVNFSALHSRLEAAYRELSHAQKTKDDLLYMIFHDMKAPVTGVKEILKLLGPGGELEPDQRDHYLALAESDLELLWRRITNLLDLNRMDALQLTLDQTQADLAQLVQEAAAGLAGVSLVNQVEVEIRPGSNPRVMVDEDLVERIVVNLLFNALKFSSPEEGGGGKVEVEVSSPGSWAQVDIIDSGPGVDQKLGESIFERYTQGNNTKGSTGLGLYFSRRAAWLLGGEVSYENLAQGGACFTLRLPLDEEV